MKLRPRFSRGSGGDAAPELPFAFYAVSALIFFIVIAILFLPDIAKWSAERDVTLAGIREFTTTVDPVNKVIIEDPRIESLLSTPREAIGASALFAGGLENIAEAFSQTEAYRMLASPVAPHILTLPAGARKEQVATLIGRELGWPKASRDQFLKIASSTLPLTEGAFSPGTYVLPDDATPEVVAQLMDERFQNRILSRYASTTMDKVPLEDAFIIASMIQREAGSVDEMRIISGIMWNRLFIGMRLQIDATLSYARGSAERGWWPVPRSRDKYIRSPYNTYQINGLPPDPISNPSIDAVIAALNPVKTDCIFYFHDDDGVFHCTKTYEEHVAKLKEKYGRGR